MRNHPCLFVWCFVYLKTLQNTLSFTSISRCLSYPISLPLHVFPAQPSAQLTKHANTITSLGDIKYYCNSNRFIHILNLLQKWHFFFSRTGLSVINITYINLRIMWIYIVLYRWIDQLNYWKVATMFIMQSDNISVHYTNFLKYIRSEKKYVYR